MTLNAKKIIGLACLCTVSIVSIVAYINYSSQPTITTREQCFAGSIDACVKEDKMNKKKYLANNTLRDMTNNIFLSTMNGIAKENKAIKEQTQKLLSGSSFQ